ncbi:hypothetical protein GS424_017745 [Eggerthella guodeyinii]|uniref:Uncharacterized protein n=1 Tax=Eggerthella guodeyinii TaxID=2690837 RepID=A0A6L7IRC4_9ACTN|nr:hypothetical protein [Eggerthella guodeyinii]QOS68290.1 hypothetical protein GS424_017745 [Eggerthella guodeyinii]
MGKWEDKITRAAHIKKHTRGTSNEISFSVLDAAKNALDGDGNDKQKHGPGRIALFTLPGRHKKPAPTPTKERGLPLSTGDFVSVDDSASTSKMGALPSAARPTSQTEKSSPAPLAVVPAKPKRSPEEEIARRKARRRLSKWLAVAVIVVVSIGLLGAGGMYLYRDYQSQQGHVAVLDDALSLVKEADETIQQLDEVVTDPFAEGSEEQRTAIQAQLEAVERKLQDADEKARAVSLELNGAREKEAANQAVAGIAARFTLVEQGQLLMNAATEAQSAAESVDAAWKTVLEGDDLARQAAQLVTETTAENVEASKSKTNEALAAFDEAYAAFLDVQATYPQADLTQFVDYIAKRQESLGYAIASDDAILAKNKEEATAQNNAYNIADAEAATLAKALPDDPSSIVDEAFEDATSDVAKAYSTARLQARSADAFISDYLGAGSK